MSQYQRVVIDDTSSDDDDDADDDYDDDADNDIDRTQDDISEDDESSDTNIQNVSRLLETLSFTKRNTYGHRIDRTDDEITSISENTYLEDSFLVKDDISFEEYLSNTSSDEESFKKKRSIYNRQNRKIVRKEADKEIAKSSSLFRSSLSDVSINNEKVSTLFELYPELEKNVNLEGNPLNNDRVEIHSECVESDESSDEKFEKYLDEVKTQSSVTKTHESRDLDGFIMTDNEPVIECSSECDSNSSDRSNDVQLIGKVMKHIGDEKIRHHNTSRNISNEHAMHWHHPTMESDVLGKIKQEKDANLLLESQNASNIHGKDDDEIFLLALSQNGPVHRVAQKYTAVKFARIREELTAKLFDVYRRRCFENKLDANMVLEWNARLRLTAGRCRCKPNGTADIELSIKVCDTPERLRDTLLHEMCHAAVWVIDHIHKGGHGPAWKYWVYQCQKVFPSLPLVERCHNYIIDAKYLYICDRCGQTIKRHSKSLDTDRKICGICQGHFILRSRDGKEFSTRPANTFAQFVKENYRTERKPGIKPAEIMKILSLRFKEAIFCLRKTGQNMYRLYTVPHRKDIELRKLKLSFLLSMRDSVVKYQ
ncbi:hypothetical protein LOAG_04258 [Loa loa]|uniref:SprT-like domain-containing protein n=1 Tax=Loa loa TaxID=7209 RepID=A0A1S0U308_LOALO|nr:hypothetical protein LOAG_04258 [Loa loa]EFO24227.2 hypothetical protein LOAG_04258 [Loa loa]